MFSDCMYVCVCVCCNTDAAGRPRDHSDSDKGYAQNIGITFHTESDFFKSLHA
jgi:hypothetical protein